MPFIPHTDDEIQAMLAAIGVSSTEELFSEIPQELVNHPAANLADGLNEMEISRLMREQAKRDEAGLCFIGAGAYEHHIPAAVWDLVSRGEFYTSYTPYQAEASQGTLQLLYEFQTMMANIVGMEVANASLYDGASALAEAVLMALRCQPRATSKRILLPSTVHPHYRQVVKTLVSPQGIEIIELPLDIKQGIIPSANLEQMEAAALIVPQPNFFGNLEEVDALTDWAHAHNMLVIAVVNPLAMALLKEPGDWGQRGADIVCGEAQPFGIPLSSGGPYCGFLATRKTWVHQLPGRIVARTVDNQGHTAFTLTLQAREQHIRRAKATSNICTNQNLLATAVTIHLSLLGPEGLRRVAALSHQRAISLAQQLTTIPGVAMVFTRPFFHEFVLRFNKPVTEILPALAALGIQAGHSLANDYPELGETLLICVTETKTSADLNYYYQQLMQVMEHREKTTVKTLAKG